MEEIKYGTANEVVSLGSTIVNPFKYVAIVKVRIRWISVQISLL